MTILPGWGGDFATVYGLTPQPPLAYVKGSTPFPLGGEHSPPALGPTSGLKCSYNRSDEHSEAAVREVNQRRDVALKARLRKWHHENLVAEELEKIKLASHFFTDMDPAISGDSISSEWFQSCIVMPISRDPSKEQSLLTSRAQTHNELRVRIGFECIGVEFPPGPINIPDTDITKEKWIQGYIDPDVLSQVIDHVDASLPLTYSGTTDNFVLAWKDLRQAWQRYQYHQNYNNSLVQQLLSQPDPSGLITDPLIGEVLKMGLPANEKQLLRCLVNPSK
jgi:hypothetical protein